MTNKEAIDILRDLNVCYECECWIDGDWGGCYRSSSTGEMNCDKKEKALDTLQETIDTIEAKKETHNDNLLTWEELIKMVGKPVWIQYDNKGIELLSEPNQWAIIATIDNNSTMPEISFVGKWKTFWMQKEFMGKHWNAYKKEKNE